MRTKNSLMSLVREKVFLRQMSALCAILANTVGTCSSCCVLLRVWKTVPSPNHKERVTGKPDKPNGETRGTNDEEQLINGFDIIWSILLNRTNSEKKRAVRK